MDKKKGKCRSLEDKRTKIKFNVLLFAHVNIVFVAYKYNTEGLSKNV